MEQGVGSTQLYKLNMRNLSCGGETDLDTKEAAVQYLIRKWMNIFAAYKQSGMTVQQYCNANQLSRDSYYYWFKKVRALTMEQMAPASPPYPAGGKIDAGPFSEIPHRLSGLRLYRHAQVHRRPDLHCAATSCETGTVHG